MGGCVSLQRGKRGEAYGPVRHRTSFRARLRFRNAAKLRNSPELANGNPSGRKTLGILMDKDTTRTSCEFPTGEESWYDAEARFASDSEDEFMSVLGDPLSAYNSLSLPQSGPATPRPTFAALKEVMQKAEANGELPSPGSLKPRVSFSNSVDENAKPHQEEEKRRKAEGTPRNSSVSVAPVSDASTDIEDGKHGPHSKSEFEGCLPCLAVSEKRSPRRRSFRLFSFKRRSSFENIDFVEDTSKVLRKPVAATQVPDAGWSRISPSSFKLRSHNYMKDRKKAPASDMSMYEAAGVDVFLSPRKIDHIARFLDIAHLVDSGASSGKENFPTLLIFNIQVPLYTASVFPAESNGEGLSLVFYYKLSETFRKNGPAYLKDMLTKFLNDDHEKVKNLVGESTVPFRERLKIVARVNNPEEIHLSATEKKLVVSYNEKPVLSRPQHVFYKGANYFEIDLDVHRFNFIARKAVETFRERLRLCVLDIGLTIQGNKPEELPECMLCCARISKLNISEYKYLNAEEDAVTPASVHI